MPSIIMHFNIKFLHTCNEILQIFHRIADKHQLPLTIFLNRPQQIIVFKLSDLSIGLLFVSAIPSNLTFSDNVIHS